MLLEAQSCNLVATNGSELLKAEADKLKQYSSRSCLIVSGIELPPSKATESAEKAEEKGRRIIETNLDICREDFDYKLDKSHRLPSDKKSSKKKQQPSLRISYINLENTVSRSIFSQKKKDILNITDKKVNPFSANVPIMDKPGSWLLLAKCLKNTCGRVTF